MKWMYMLVFLFSALTEYYVGAGYRKGTIAKRIFIFLTILEIIILFLSAYCIIFGEPTSLFDL